MSHPKPLLVGTAFVTTFLVAMALAPSATALPSDLKPVVNAQDVWIENPEDLEDGRLPQNVVLRVGYEMSVQFAPFSYCTFDVQMHYQWTDGQQHGFGVLSPSQQVQSFDSGEPVPFLSLAGHEQTGWETMLSFILDPSVASGTAITLEVEARAVASHSQTDTCNVGESHPASGALLIIAA